MAKRLGEEYWRKHLQSWEGSGLSQIAYCTQQGLKAKTFSRWRGKALARTEAASKAPPLTVVPIRVETSAVRATQTTPGIVRLHSPGGWRIELADSSAIKLAELLRQLP